MATNRIQGADDDTWLIDIKKDIADLKSLAIGYTICRVPDKFRIEKNDAYSPLTISIGPIHHGNVNLKAMEEHKLAHLLSLLERTRDETGALDACGHATSELYETVRDCYEEKYEEKFKHSKTAFVRMLFLDGCFILELFIRYYMNDCRPDDPILLNPRMISAVRRDLALLENQIPFSVLEDLFEVIKNNSDHINLPNLVDLAFYFFELDTLTSKGRKFLTRKRRSFFHLLDLIHKCYSPSSASERTSRKETWKLIHSATKLSEAGVEFVGIEPETDRKKSLESDQKRSLFDLKFEDGVIEIPQLCVESSLFQNLIAMEQCLHSHEHYMTSYGLLMDYLVDTSKDVEFLVKKKIIPHNFGDYGQVADLFNNISKQSIVQGFYFAGLCDQLDDHYKTKWHIYWKSLLRDYIGNPWMVTSVFAASILLVVTILQTVYSVLSYYHI